MKSLIIASVLAALPAGAYASQLDSLAQAIVLADPAWQAREASLRASAAAVKAANTLPGPEAEGEYLWGPAGDNRWGAGVSQSFDWPGVYAARRAESRAAANAFDRLASAELAERTLAARLTLIDLIAARRRASTVGRIADNLRRQTELTQRALDHGQATILDLRKLQIAALEAGTRLEQAEQARAEAIGQLRAMGLRAEVPDGLTYPDATDTDAAVQNWNAMPGVRAAEAEAEAAEARARAAARSLLPGFSIGYRHQFEGGNHFNGISFGISLPSWGSKKALRAARAEAEAARMQSEVAHSSHDAALETLLRSLPGLKARTEAYRDALDTSDYPVLLEKSLNGGQISILTYIQELNFFLEAEMARIEAEQQYQAALASLSRFNTWH